MLSIAIGCDDAAIEMKNQIVIFLQSKNITVVDYSCDQHQEPTMYPDIAIQVALAIKAGKHERGILICGTGIGMSISANKVLASVQLSAMILFLPNEPEKATMPKLSV